MIVGIDNGIRCRKPRKKPVPNGGKGTRKKTPRPKTVVKQCEMPLPDSQCECEGLVLCEIAPPGGGLVVDLFAGGGGASIGMEAALGRPIDIAINHSRHAIRMHQNNHPYTRHYIEDIWKVSPRRACGTRPVYLLWASPSCTHFSRASGNANPKCAKIRSLAWVVIRWAREMKPSVIMLENVVEFLDWGPLDAKGKPIKSKKGRTFKIWLGKLRAQGYVVEWRKIRAADYGAPTIRERVFLIARRDGLPIVWPAPSHAKNGVGGLPKWRAAAECVDWDLPCTSIFERKKPLKEKTLKRIAAGIMRYVVNTTRPFVMAYHSGDARRSNRTQPIDEPLRTVDTENRYALVTPVVMTNTTGHAPNSVEEPLATITSGGHHMLVASHITKYRTGSVGSDIEDPFPTVTANSFIKRPGGGVPLGLVGATIVPLTHAGGNERAHDAAQPMPTITGAHRGEQLLAIPYVVGLRGTSDDAVVSSASSVEDPLRTISAGGGHHALVVPMVSPVKTYGGGGNEAYSADSPLRTITASKRGEQALVAATLVQSGYGERKGQAPRALNIEAPLGTVVGGACKHALVAAHITKHFGGPRGTAGARADEPLGAVTTVDHHALTTSVLAPSSTSHAERVREFLATYGTQPTPPSAQPAQQSLDLPQTPTTAPPMAVTVQGAEYVITDIRTRMFAPKELFAAQAFPAKYDTSGFTKTQQISLCGNSVCPPVAEAVVRANMVTQ